ncbi:MAG TPA: amidohydrolase family protein [Methylomirabilota bacterium]|nr:amidohydrolase family protein [Methylomirabilota bacterium]
MQAPEGFRYIDIHTHLHPERLSRAIRKWFAERSDWKLEYPTEPELVAAFLRDHFKGFKFHINVQRFFPDDPRVLPVYERLLALDRFLLIHVGSAPWPNAFDGFPRFARVMDMFPRLKVVVAHMGSFETRQFMQLMERCPNLYLDTTMAFAPVRPEHRAIDTRLNRISVTNDDLLRWQDRIVFGSDFPNLPYAYEEEREALWLRDLPLPVYRKIFHDNAAALLGLA